MSESEYQENYHFIVSHPEAVAREMTRLTARIQQLEKLLRPFAKAANGFDSYNIKDPEEWFCYGGVQGSGETTGAITVGDLRRARAAMGEKNGN